MSAAARFAATAILAPHPLAGAAGRDVFAQGGSALEAAAAAFAISAIMLDHRCGLAGDAVWLVREPTGRIHAIDGVSMAGSGASLARYHKAGHDDIPKRGPRAVLAVPGAPASLAMALDMARAFGGKMPLGDIFAPAIKLARSGFAQDWTHPPATPSDLDELAQQSGFAEKFLSDGKWTAAGTIQRPTKLADTLDHLAHAGLADFYRGDIAREMAHDLGQIKSPLLRNDLERYEARLRKPLALRIGTWNCARPGPPTSGLSALLATALHAQSGAGVHDNLASLQMMIEAAKHARIIAAPFAIDPGAVESDPTDWLSPQTISRETMALSRERAGPLTFGGHEGNSILIAAIDTTGLAVACAATLGDNFGAGCILPRTGLLMANRGAFFSLDPAAPHVLQPARRSPRAPAPAIAVNHDGRIFLHGSGNAETDLQVFARMSAGMGLVEALDMARFALAQDKDGAIIRLEDRFDPSTLRQLERAGHHLVNDGVASCAQNDAGGVLMRRRDASIESACDPRGHSFVDGL